MNDEDDDEFDLEDSEDEDEEGDEDDEDEEEGPTDRDILKSFYEVSLSFLPSYSCFVRDMKKEVKSADG